MIPKKLIIEISGIILGAFIILIGLKLKSISKDTASLMILGMKQAGKTRWLCFLRSKNYVEGSTADREAYGKFTITRSNGSSLEIKSGYDYNGSVENVGRYYKQALNGATGKFAIMFFFNMLRYLENAAEMEKGKKMSYRLAVVHRLGHIENLMKEKGINKDAFYLVMTYRDKVEASGYDSKEKMTEIIDDLRVKHDLKDLIGDNVIAINTTNREELTEFKNKLKL